MLKTRSVGAHSICARGSLSYRKRARADMESAPTFFVGAERTRVFPCCVCRGDHWSPANLPPQRIFRDSCLVRQAGTGEQCSPLQMFFDSLSPKYSCPPLVSLPHRLRAEPPRRGGQERGAFLPVVRASGFISACALSKTILCGILFLYKSTGKPGANRRRKAIGAHRVSQLPTRNCCFTAAASFASFLGQELTRVKTHRYTGGTKQGIYNVLLFSAARGYCLIRSDSAFRYGSAMP